MVKANYLKQMKVTYSQGMEIDVQQFFTVMKDIYMLAAEKKLLRSVILLSFVSIHASLLFSAGTQRRDMMRSMH
jgi:hypothetical protein